MYFLFACLVLLPVSVPVFLPPVWFSNYFHLLTLSFCIPSPDLACHCDSSCVYLCLSFLLCRFVVDVPVLYCSCLSPLVPDPVLPGLYHRVCTCSVFLGFFVLFGPVWPSLWSGPIVFFVVVIMCVFQIFLIKNILNCYINIPASLLSLSGPTSCQNTANTFKSIKCH